MGYLNWSGFRRDIGGSKRYKGSFFIVSVSEELEFTFNKNGSYKYSWREARDTLTNHHLDNSVPSYHFNFVVCYLFPSIFSNKVDLMPDRGDRRY